MLVLLLLAAGPAASQTDTWKVIEERDGIVVSQRPVEDRAFPRVRAVGEVRGTPYEILAVLLDVTSHVGWLPDCVASNFLRRLGPWRYVIYMRTDAPWPVADREAVVENEVFFLDPPSRVKVKFDSISAPDVALEPGAVRMKSLSGFYSIEAIDDERSLVHYEVDADPAGSLPTWLITMQSTRNPLQTLTGLRKRLHETRGQYEAQIDTFPR